MEFLEPAVITGSIAAGYVEKLAAWKPSKAKVVCVGGAWFKNNAFFRWMIFTVILHSLQAGRYYF